MKRTSYSRFLARAAVTLLAVLFSFTGARAQETVTIGSLEGASNDSYLPMNSLYEYSYTQQIYTADEIGMAGTINSITVWMYGNTNLYEMPFDIYMVEVDKETFDSTTDWVPVTSSNIVYSGSVTVHNTTAEAYTFDLQTPFVYSGTGNLLICFDNNTGQWKSGLNGMVFTAGDAVVRSIYARRDGTDYDPTNMADISGYGTTAKRNVIELAITPNSDCDMPTSISVSNITTEGATITWDSNGKAWNLRYKALDETDWNTVEDLDEKTCTLTGLEENTTYQVGVQTVCSASSTSFFKSTTFTTANPCAAPTDLVISDITTKSAVLTWTPGYQETEWTVKYKKSSDSDWEEFTVEASDLPVTLDGLEENTQYNVQIYNCKEEGSPYLQGSFKTAYGCAAPTDLVISDITTESATLTWTPGYQETEWTVKYKKSSDSDWDDFTVEDSDLPVTLDGLEGITQYDVRVYTCTGDDMPYLSGNFVTAPSFPYSQDFSASGIPIGWAQYTGLLADVMNGTALTSTSYGWSNGTDHSVLDGNHIYSNIYGNSCKKWIVTPAIPLGSDARITFDVAYTAYSSTAADPQTSGDDDKFVVLISTDNMATWTILRQWDNASSEYVLNSLTPTALNTNISLADYAGQSAIIAFYAESTASNADNNIHIDNVVIETKPACEKPQNIAINYTGGLTAEVTWEGEADQYNIDVNGTVTNNVTSPYTLEGLELATTYEVKLQAVCSASAQSEWTAPVSFTTDRCLPDDMCSLTFTVTDSYGDGWNGASIAIYDYTGEEFGELLATVTNQNLDGQNGEETQTYTLNFCNGQELAIIWSSGNYDSECSYTITDINGDIVAQDDTDLGIAYTIDCTVTDCRKPSDFAASEIGTNSVVLSWTENGPATEWVISYISENDTELTEITVSENPYTLTDLTPATQYAAIVTPVCDVDKESEVIYFTTLSFADAKPYDLTVTPYPTKAEVNWNGFSESYDIEWTEAAVNYEPSANALWLQYDDETLATNIGNSSATTWTWGVMYPSTMLNGNSYLNKVAIYEVATYWTSDYTVNIYTGGDNAPGTLVGTETVTPSGTNGFHEIMLSEPVTIDPNEKLWITVTAEGTYVLAACETTEANNQWVEDGGTWANIGDLSSTLAGYGWMIRGFIDSTVPTITWNSETDVTSPFTINGLTEETEYKVRVRGNFGSNGYSNWTLKSFTTPAACDAPIDLAADDITSTTATLSWTGYQDSYNVQYRKAAKYNTIWEDDFENGLDQWTIAHADDATAPASGYWYTIDPTSGLSFESHSGTYCASSWSWNSSAYNANNWLITPLLNLQGTLRFYVGTNSGYPDSYEVLLSTTGNEIADFTTTLQEMAAAPNNGEWNEVAIDLSTYAGQQGYIAIHHMDYDMNYLVIDDFGIYEVEGASDWTTATASEESLAISGLTPDSEYEWQVQGINEGCTGGATEWSEVATFTTLPLIELVDNDLTATEKNSDIIGANDTQVADVKLSGRTLYTEVWNTLCLPFKLTLAGSPLEGATVKTLQETVENGDVISLKFGEQSVTEMAAGKPYIVKLAGNENIAEPVFTGVTINATTDHAVTSGDVQFIGYYNTLRLWPDGTGDFDAADVPSIYYLKGDGKLYFTDVARTLSPLRAYFKIAASTKGRIVLDFGDGEVTGISDINSDTTSNGDWYNVNGMKLNQQPTRKGLYIQNGRKVVIK